MSRLDLIFFFTETENGFSKMSDPKCPSDPCPDGLLGPDPELYDEGQPQYPNCGHGQGPPTSRLILCLDFLCENRLKLAIC